MIYIDTSALLKLVKDDEVEGNALRSYLGATASGSQPVSSTLLAVEARRGILRNRPAALPHVDVLLTGVSQVAISDAVIEMASRLPDALLRTLDAIHLATALLIRDDIEALVTYDTRLADAARTHGLAVATPSDWPDATAPHLRRGARGH